MIRVAGVIFGDDQITASWPGATHVSVLPGCFQHLLAESHWSNPGLSDTLRYCRVTKVDAAPIGVHRSPWCSSFFEVGFWQIGGCQDWKPMETCHGISGAKSQWHHEGSTRYRSKVCGPQHTDELASSHAALDLWPIVWLDICHFQIPHMSRYVSRSCTINETNQINSSCPNIFSYRLWQ